MEEIKIGGRSNGKSLENAITFMKYIDELENNKLYGIKKSGNITLLTKTECIPISLIEKRIEILDMRIKHLRKELEKSCEERVTLGTETDIDNNEAYIFHIEEELNHRCAERNALRELLDERNNTDV